MKNTLSLLICLLTILGCNNFDTQTPLRGGSTESNRFNTQGFTTLSIKNSSTLDTVEVFITLQSTEDVFGMFGITTHGDKGSFFARKDSTYLYADARPLTGFLISFGHDNISCNASTAPPTGVNVFEGSINVDYECIDISAVDGVNSLMRYSVSQPNWLVGNTTVYFKSGENKPLGKNCGNIGIFPYRCTDCVQSINPPPPCPGKVKFKCNKNRTCQINRHSKKGGGILLEFLNFTKRNI